MGGKKDWDFSQVFLCKIHWKQQNKVCSYSNSKWGSFDEDGTTHLFFNWKSDMGKISLPQPLEAANERPWLTGCIWAPSDSKRQINLDQQKNGTKTIQGLWISSQVYSRSKVDQIRNNQNIDAIVGHQ